MSKHLTLEERYKIEEALNENKSFKFIGTLINKDCTTISKEVKKNYTTVKPSSFNNNFNYCKNRQHCAYYNLCNNNCNNKCSLCFKCNSVCDDYILDTCENNDKAPYVCNGCKSRNGCRKVKYIYKAKEANEIYLNLLKTSREGVNLTKEELTEKGKIIIPLIKNGHSPAMIVMNNPDLRRSESIEENQPISYT